MKLTLHESIHIRFLSISFETRVFKFLTKSSKNEEQCGAGRVHISSRAEKLVCSLVKQPRWLRRVLCPAFSRHAIQTQGL